MTGAKVGKYIEKMIEVGKKDHEKHIKAVLTGHGGLKLAQLSPTLTFP